MRQDRRRRDGLVPSARRPGDLRSPGASRPGFRLALSADRRPGQFRQHRRRRRRRLSLHRSAHDRRRAAAARRGRRGSGRLARQLFRRREGADRPAVGDPQPARQWRAGHRRRHGDLDPAAQRRRAVRRRALSHRPPESRGRGAARLCAGTGFSHWRHRRRRPGVDRRDLSHRARRLSLARPLDTRGDRARWLGRGRHRDPVRRAEVAPDRAARDAADRAQGASARRRPRRVGRRRARRARAAQSVDRTGDDDGAAVQAQRARDAHTGQPQRAGRRRDAARRQFRRSAAAMARPPPRRAHAPLRPSARGDRAPARAGGGDDRRLPQPRRGHPHHPRGRRAEGGANGALRAHRDAGQLHPRHPLAFTAPPRGDGAAQGADDAQRGEGLDRDVARQRKEAMAGGRLRDPRRQEEIRAGNQARQAAHHFRDA